MNTINNPPHYQACSPIGRQFLIPYMGISDFDLDLECIEFLERNHQYCNFHLGNAIKYLWRSGIKGDEAEDLGKALWYLRRWRSADNQNYAFLFLSVFCHSKSRHLLNGRIDRLANAIEFYLIKTTPNTKP